VVSSLQVFQLKPFTHFSTLPCMLQPHPSHLWLDHTNNIWWTVQLQGSSSLFSLLQPPNTSTFLDLNILLSTLFSTPSIYVLPLLYKPKFHTHTQLVKLQLSE
jgi:hypothetical protein